MAQGWTVGYSSCAYQINSFSLPCLLPSAAYCTQASLCAKLSCGFFSVLEFLVLYHSLTHLHTNSAPNSVTRFQSGFLLSLTHHSPVWGSLTTTSKQFCSGHQLGALKFNPVLTLSSWRKLHIAQVGQQGCLPDLRTSHSPRLWPVLLPHQQWPLPGV